MQSDATGEVSKNFREKTYSRLQTFYVATKNFVFNHHESAFPIIKQLVADAFPRYGELTELEKVKRLGAALLPILQIQTETVKAGVMSFHLLEVGYHTQSSFRISRDSERMFRF